MNDRATFKYVKKFRTPPFPLAFHIPSMFAKLEEDASTEQLKALTRYILRTWIDSSLWPPATWSVYFEPIRTNNDLEGWHNCINKKGKHELNLYLLIDFLFKETSYLSIQMRLVSDRKMVRMQNKNYRDHKSRLFGYWQEYEQEE